MGLDMYLTKKTYIGHSGFSGPLCPHEVRDRPYMNNDANPVEPSDECVACPAFDPETMPHLAHIKPERVKGIDEEIGYWRKANAIHQWFVNNVQDGEDDCREAYVERDSLRELRDLCQSIIDKAVLVEGKIHTGTSYSGGETVQHYTDGKVVENADEIRDMLPPQSGFFFGGTDIDEWYIRDLKDTVEIIDAVFADDEAYMKATGASYPAGDIYYRSSW